jgi:hypothetical protein
MAATVGLALPMSCQSSTTDGLIHFRNVRLRKGEAIMGMVKNWQMGEAESERRHEVREWLQNKLGRQPTEVEIDGYWDEFELAEAFDQDWDSPGWA